MPMQKVKEFDILFLILELCCAMPMAMDVFDVLVEYLDLQKFL